MALFGDERVVQIRINRAKDGGCPRSSHAYGGGSVSDLAGNSMTGPCGLNVGAVVAREWWQGLTPGCIPRGEARDAAVPRDRDSLVGGRLAVGVVVLFVIGVAEIVIALRPL